jgi:hypothetical protein
VSCRAKCGTAQERIELDASEPERRLDLRLAERPGVLVRITSTTGEPISVVTCAVATLDAPGEWIEEADFNPVNHVGVGWFQPNDAWPRPQSGAYVGRIVLEVPPPVYVSLLRYQRVLATVRVERPGDDAQFVIDPNSRLLGECALRGRAVDATKRQPLSEALVFIGARISRSDPDAPGVFSASGLWPGRYDIVICKNGFGVVHTTALLEPGATLDLGDVEVQPESWINGLAVDAQGQGVFARLRIEPLDGKPMPVWRASVNDETTSKDDGTFHIGSLLPGKYLLKVVNTESLPWATKVQLVDTSIGPIEGVRVEVSPGVELVVRAANENAIGTRWTLRNSDGLRVMSMHLDSEVPMAMKFAPGTYTVEVEMPNGAAPRVREVVLASDPVELALP